uniref:VPS37 C-terminal domain-containing protein n=1 Tax=Helicotheca tamesis TaxID=374047 RepID=A0A7S2IGW3_9STRA|mmetsp:Transcript_9118/g.12667  ORF Transcript_9118/g.12667 Transcript_9118/m.12667 type:complete len:387 (+) Transcript_9118:49-1209(+)
MFSWSRSSGTSSSYPGNRNNNRQSTTAPTPAARASITSRYNRNDHIQSYLNDPTLKPSTRRVSRDDSTYDTVFQTKSGYALILRVHLPVAASTTSLPPPPGMTLVGVRATHPWVDGKMRVIGYDPVNSAQNWASSGLLLGNAVSTVVQHLQLYPPNVIEITDDSLQRLQASIQGGAAGGGGRQQQNRFPSNPPRSSLTQAPPDYQTALETGGGDDDHNIPIPPVPSSFPELESMSRSEMQELLDDEEKYQAFVEEMPSVKTLNDLKSSIFKGNVETAESNLKHEEELGELHAEVQSLKEGLKEKVEKFRELESKQAELTRPPDKRDVIKKLTKAKKDAFNESEDIASAWLDDGGEDDIDEFVEKFLERRTVHHMRAAKIERLTATM